MIRQDLSGKLTVCHGKSTIFDGVFPQEEWKMFKGYVSLPDGFFVETMFFFGWGVRDSRKKNAG